MTLKMGGPAVGLNQLLAYLLFWIRATTALVVQDLMGNFPKKCPNPHRPVYLNKAFWKQREDSMLSITVDRVVDPASSTTKDTKWAYLGGCRPHHSIPWAVESPPFSSSS